MSFYCCWWNLLTPERRLIISLWEQECNKISDSLNGTFVFCWWVLFVISYLFSFNFDKVILVNCKPHLDDAEPRSDPLECRLLILNHFLTFAGKLRICMRKRICRSKLAPRLHSSTHIGHGERLFWRLLKKDPTLLKSPGEPQASVKQRFRQTLRLALESTVVMQGSIMQVRVDDAGGAEVLEKRRGRTFHIIRSLGN